MFSTFRVVQWLSLSNFRSFLSPWEEILYPSVAVLYSSSLQSLTTPNLFSASVLPVLDISHERNHTRCCWLCLTFFHLAGRFQGSSMLQYYVSVLCFFFPQFFFVVVKYTWHKIYYLNHFKVYLSVVLSTTYCYVTLTTIHHQNSSSSKLKL